MVRLVDEALRGPLFGRTHGLASGDVTIADPAVGTGTFLLGVMRSIATTVGDDLGPGGVPGALQDAAKRLIGFELQFGPFAVAQLRLLAEFAELSEAAGTSGTLPDLKPFITDTLGNPFVEDEHIPSMMLPIAKSRQDANAIKKGQPITVVIGNPPYKEKADGRGGWIEDGSKGRQAPMERWRPPASWGVGAHTKHLKNLYIYFWRWASLKVFGAGQFDATGIKETDEEGIVCFITVAGFLNGPGFQKMRADLRESCTDIWVIDCSPEGHQPEVASRIFQRCAAAGLHRVGCSEAWQRCEGGSAGALPFATRGAAGGEIQGSCGDDAGRRLGGCAHGLARGFPTGGDGAIG